MTLKFLPVALATLTSLSAFADPVTLTNAGFEADWSAIASAGHDGDLTFDYQPNSGPLGWTFGVSTGVASSYSLLSAYEGNRFALLQTATGELSHEFYLGSAGQVDLSFALALRTNYAAGQQVSVLLDGQALELLTAASTDWALQSVALGQLQAGQHTLAFKGMADYGQFGDTTAFIDAVKLNVSAVPEPGSLALLLAGLGLLAATTRRKKAR